MTRDDISIDSPIEEKIAWAEKCYGSKGQAILKDKKVRDLLQRLRDAARSSHDEMVKTGLVSICRNCEEEDGGSCCGLGLERKYTGLLLLINLLLGTQIPKKRLNHSSCFFLGERGCQLTARQVICINYLCKSITDRIEPQNLAALREKEGIEIETLFLLNEKIKDLLLRCV